MGHHHFLSFLGAKQAKVTSLVILGFISRTAGASFLILKVPSVKLSSLLRIFLPPEFATIRSWLQCGADEGLGSVKLHIVSLLSTQPMRQSQ